MLQSSDYICDFFYKLPQWERIKLTLYHNRRLDSKLPQIKCIEKMPCIVKEKGTFRNMLFKIQANLLKKKSLSRIVQLNITQLNKVSGLCKHKAKWLINYTHAVFALSEYWMVHGHFIIQGRIILLKLSLRHNRERLSVWMHKDGR